MPSRALIVDDEPVVVALLKTILATAGMDALIVRRSGDAAEHLGTEKFAVVLIDLGIPPSDGLELSRHTRASGINQMTPIILMSDDQSTSATAQGFASGASFFLYKPIDKSRFLALVRATQGAIEQERRRFRRVGLQTKVSVASDNQEWDFETIDVSLNGMLVKGPVSFSQGAAVRVKLYLLPGTKPIEGAGSIVRVMSDHRMGIQLTQLSVAESGRLQDFLLPIILRDDQPANVVVP